jgi:hypothetical protein
LADFFSSGNGVAGPEIGAADSLARAISELREELLSWVDTELSRLQELQWEEDRSMKVIADVPGSIGSRPRNAGMVVPPTGPDGDSPGTSDEVSGMGRGTTRSRGWPEHRNSYADVNESAVAVRGPGMDCEPQSTPSNPGERLDALARRLDHRLKQAAGAPKMHPDATAGTGEGHAR